MVECIAAQAVYLFLVQLFAAHLLVLAPAFALDGGQTHPSIAQDAHPLASLGIGAVGHLIHRHGVGVVSCGVKVLMAAACTHAASRQHGAGRCGSRGLEKASSVYLTAHDDMS